MFGIGLAEIVFAIVIVAAILLLIRASGRRS
jgi:hypothetical protein